VVNTTTLTAVTTIKLDNNGKAILGIPKVMAADSNGNIWIGSTGNCAITTDVHGLTQPPGCLHVYNPTSGQVFANTPPQAFFAGLSDATDDVSSMVWLNPLNGRNVMYVVEGGEVVPYGFDGSTLAPSACAGTQDQPCIIDIVGQAVDVKAAF
jgi:hypothetical protein